MIQLFKWILFGIGAALAGLVFAALFGTLCSGLPYGDAVNLGMSTFTCFICVTCTGIILSHLQKP